MNEHELDRVLDAIHQGRADLVESPQLHERALAVPLQTPQRRSWLPHSLKWRFGSMFSATKFVVAGAIVALFGGFLLAGVLTQQPSDEHLPAVGSTPSALEEAKSPDSASIAPDLLPGVDLVAEEVEPGVYRVVSDGARDLEWDFMELPFPWEQPAVVSEGGVVWLAIGESAMRLGVDGEFEVEWDTDRPRGVEVTGPSSVRLVPAERGEITWTHPGRSRTLRRHSPAGMEVFDAADDTPVFTGIAPMIGPRTVVAPDGAGWFSLFDSFGRNEVASSDCGGLTRYDGRRSTYFLQDRGFCVSGLDVDDRGQVWVLGWSHVLPDGAAMDGSGWIEEPIGLYVITPEAIRATEPAESEPGPSGDHEATAAMVITPGPQPGVDLVIEEVEPGVNRVIAVIHNGDFETDLPAVDQVATAPDGTVWVVAGPYFGRMGDYDMLRGSTMPGGDQDPDWQLTVGVDGTPVAYKPGLASRIARFADDEWHSYPTDDWSAVLAATTTATGDLWASVNAGDDEFAVGHYGSEGWTWYDRADLGVREGWVHDFAETPDGTIWAGVDNYGGPTQGGLSRFDGREWHLVDPFSTDGRFAAADLEVAPDGTLWVGMQREGRGLYLGRWDGSEWTVRPRDGTWGLPTDSLSDDEEAWPPAVVHPNDLGLGEPTGIERTPDGSVWWTTESGLYVITPEAVEAAE